MEENGEIRSSRKANAAKIAMTVAFCLALSKAIVGFMTGSLAILSSAADSLLDIIASFFNFAAIKKAESPADSEHPFGHGKYESLAAFLQSFIIFSAGLVILITAWSKFRSGDHPSMSYEGIAVMGAATAATIFLTIFLRYIAKKENSSALEADALHYATDLYTNIGILISLIIINITGFYIIDTIIASLAAIYIMYSAVKLSVKVSGVLLDVRVEEDTYNKLVNILKSFGYYHLDFHRLRTRSSGHEKFIDMHMTLCARLTLAEVHKITDAIEKSVKREIPDADVTIHPEPCEHDESNYNTSGCRAPDIRDAIKKLE